MKKSILIIFLFLSSFSFAQQSEIVRLLNKKFGKEQKIYGKFDSDKPTLVQPFQIKNDTLSVEVSLLFENDEEKTRHFQRSVHLKDITAFIKDMNVLFMAKEGSVKEIITEKDKNGNVLETKSNFTDLFFTELKKDQNDHSLQQKMIKAFGNAGFKISSEYWYN